MNILILSCGTRSLLVDYFMNRKNGFEKVVVTDCSADSPALYRADRFYIVPRMKELTYLPRLFDICDKEKINAVLPLQEDELVLIAENRNEFIRKGILPIISELELVQLCRDKYSFYKEMEQSDILAIPTYKVEEMTEVIDKYGFPLFMKPRYGAGSCSSYVIHKKSVIDSNLENDSEDFILQPFIEGTEYGVNAYVDFVTGELSEIFILRKIRMRAGETEKSQSVHNDEIKSIIEQICKKLPLVGPIDIDIIEKDGKFYVLEINPRFGGAYPHTHECGVNFIKLIANNVAHIANKKFVMNYEEGIVALRYMTITTMKRRDMPNEK